MIDGFITVAKIVNILVLVSLGAASIRSAFGSSRGATERVSMGTPAAVLAGL